MAQAFRRGPVPAQSARTQIRPSTCAPPGEYGYGVTRTPPNVTARLPSDAKDQPRAPE